MGEPLSGLRNSRLRPIDAARGTAMLFVCLSHFVEVTINYCSMPVTMFYAVTMIASPAFIVISGTIMGILARTRGQRFEQTRHRFFWRGIFLLTVGRFLILVAHIPYAGGWDPALRWAFMTDAIAVCILLAPTLVAHVGLRARAALGLVVFFLSWIVILLWHPGGYAGPLFKEFFFGLFRSPDRFFADVFPVVPWFGLYLMATALGESLGGHLVAGRRDRVMRMTLQTAAATLGVAVGLIGLRYALEHPAGLGSAAVHMLLSPLQKLPPGPVYVLFYSGITLIILWALLRFEPARPVRLYSRFVELFGRNSLFVFIIQYFVYFGFFPLVAPGPRILWPLVFILSVALLWGTTRLWEWGKTQRSFATAG